MAVNPTPESVSPRVLFQAADDYDRSSVTQRAQAERLLGALTLEGGERVLDAGCGSGTLALAVAAVAASVRVHAIDISPHMLRVARERARGAGVGNITWETGDVLGLDATHEYDVVCSNAAMHWVLPPDRAYGRLFAALRHGGKLAVHQGGSGCYQGLWQHAVDLIGDRGLSRCLVNWKYPVYYPSANDFEELLSGAGFTEIAVESYESDGTEFGNLIRDFSNGGLLPFLGRLPAAERDDFKQEFIRSAERDGVDTYTHRLFALARRP